MSVVHSMKFFDRAEVKDMLAYLCVLNNPMDDLRLKRIINVPGRGIGPTTVEKMETLAAQQGVTLYEILRNADLFAELKTPAARLMKFADLIDALRSAGSTLELPDFYDAVCDQTGYVRALEEKKDLESRGRIENVQELRSNIVSFMNGREYLGCVLMLAAVVLAQLPERSKGRAASMAGEPRGK